VLNAHRRQNIHQMFNAYIVFKIKRFIMKEAKRNAVYVQKFIKIAKNVK